MKIEYTPEIILKAITWYIELKQSATPAKDDLFVLLLDIEDARINVLTDQEEEFFEYWVAGSNNGELVKRFAPETLEKKFGFQNKWARTTKKRISKKIASYLNAGE